ncbi:putative RNA-directed DNA polymerase, eukaryota, reverse transcriptase zinc-binding domain protein [Tanacetum coccineum]
MLAKLVASWNGVIVMMGDFNEVREAGERYGSVFKEKQAELFHDFITNASLSDTHLGGFNFTLTDKWGSKMSKLDQFLVSESFYEVFPHNLGVVLEKGIPDHQPILLHETVVDYGPTPFRFFHSWLEMDGFHNLVRSTWKNDSIVDQGCASKEDITIRKESIVTLNELHRIDALDLAQKAKIKWAIEGDENTKFFHGSLKTKRRQLAIKGILKDGEWIEEPDRVKTEFFTHFCNRFQKPIRFPPSLDVAYASPLSSDQRDLLERDFIQEDIKRVVWDCGGDRSPGPDGFSFKCFTTFWDLLEEDVVRFILEFFHSGYFLKGCNSLFIALILKVSNAKYVTDFRPMSLIGCQYKIIGKLLANRLSMVIGSCISSEQSDFIKGRNILDGPFILNEVLAW